MWLGDRIHTHRYHSGDALNVSGMIHKKLTTLFSGKGSWVPKGEKREENFSLCSILYMLCLN